MAKVTYNVKVEVEVSDSDSELLKVAAREIIAGISTSVDHNQNVEDIEVTSIQATEVITSITDCMPEELNNLG